MIFDRFLIVGSFDVFIYPFQEYKKVRIIFDKNLKIITIESTVKYLDVVYTNKPLIDYNYLTNYYEKI